MNAHLLTIKEKTNRLVQMKIWSGSLVFEVKSPVHSGFRFNHISRLGLKVVAGNVPLHRCKKKMNS